MIDNTYRQAFSSFVKTGNIGPFAEKKQLTTQQVDKELELFQQTRERYQALDQSGADENRHPGSLQVHPDIAFPPPAPSKQNESFIKNLDQAIEDLGIGADTSKDRLQVEMTDKQIEVEESGAYAGVSLTRTEGSDIYHMDVSFDGQMDIVTALHIDKATGIGTSQTLRYEVPQDSAGESHGTSQGNSAMQITEDENGVLRFNWD